MNSNIFDRKSKIAEIMRIFPVYRRLIGRTLYTSLDLLSAEEFLAIHPEHAELEGHELMLKRLEHESDQRNELDAKRKDLASRRTATQADSKKRKNDLDNLTETLKKFIEVSCHKGLLLMV
jgi:flagellar motility protein MotE (MotC chaperone)